MSRSEVPLGEGWTLLPALSLSCLAVGLTAIVGLRHSPAPAVPPDGSPKAEVNTPAPSPSVVAPAAPARPLDCPPSLEFHFAAGAAAPLANPDAEPFLAWLTRHPTSRVVVDGHADTHGTVARNLALSHARAESAAQWLIERGLQRSRITARGFGAYQPLAGEDGATDRNRRVEVWVQDQAACPRGVEP